MKEMDVLLKFDFPSMTSSLIFFDLFGPIAIGMAAADQQTKQVFILGLL